MIIPEKCPGCYLTGKQLAERHGISSDRVTQWLCLLKLPDEIQQRVIELGDNWSKQIVTERELREFRKKHQAEGFKIL